MFYKQNMSLNMQEVAFAFWVGVNDIYKILEQHQVVDCIGTQVRQVRQVFSAHKFIVFNMPPMEQMPFYANTEFANTREKATNEFNEFLRKDIEKMNKHLQAIELDLVDVHRLIQDMVEKSDLFEIKNVKDPYWDVCQGQCDDAIDSYVWWDKTHLTGGVHRLIANSILMSGSLAEETSLSNDVDVNALLNEPNSHYRSAIYKAKKNTGAMAKQIEKLKKEDTSTSAENDLEVDQDDSHAGFMYLFILCAVLACAGFFLYKKRKGSHLAALSGLIKNNNNSDRGRFMPLRNMDSEV
ncbi:uncharacterized protein B0P05DRAFT_548807 [Gilbertella persicaria]|uniref:uncharacterized protein n=1 Tax=Gilbertella persicaria TaxID=101096 RepID=UPI002220C6A4|nr:uncharacterized protein B0P05DRAFT_548807 [Gilbertella persicaria]KAI8073496.1 hypothetical protein B0P05DRAFT_548807 [Gilbertella persicaria]